MAATVETQYVQSQVGKIQLRRGGSGSPLVYLHSAMGEGEALPMLDELAGVAELIAPMFPGFGDSEGIEQIDDMEDAVFHMLDVLDELGLPAPALMGTSLGAWLALEIATRYPERAGRLVLVNPVGLHLDGTPIKDIFGRSPGELAEDMFADQSHPMAQMMHAVGDFRSDPTLMGNLTFDMIKPLAQTMAATAKLGWDPYLHNPKLPRRLHRVTAPTLIIRGKQDTLVPPEHARYYEAHIPGARLVEVDGAAHMMPLEKATEITALVRDFLAA
jgi:pimeloyl-ACP methyl ester carboxylesterase